MTSAVTGQVVPQQVAGSKRPCEESSPVHSAWCHRARFEAGNGSANAIIQYDDDNDDDDDDDENDVFRKTRLFEEYGMKTSRITYAGQTCTNPAL